jgi:prepilin-type N-terminal cleavage/methylation domain-containing protein
MISTMKKYKQGFTLLELIIALFLFGAIVALVAGFGVYFFKNYAFSFEEQQEIGQAQTALTQMIREIRKIQTADNGSWPLVQTDNNSFIFYADVNSDGKADRVRYFLNGKDLQRGVIPPTEVPVTYPLQNELVQTIATNITATPSAIFAYYNENWPSDLVNNPLIASQRIFNTRFVQVTINVDTIPNFSAGAFSLTSGTSIRSMKTNL